MSDAPAIVEYGRYRVTGISAYEGREGTCIAVHPGSFGRVHLDLKLDGGSSVRLRDADVEPVVGDPDALRRLAEGAPMEGWVCKTCGTNVLVATDLLPSPGGPICPNRVAHGSMLWFGPARRPDPVRNPA